MLTKMLQFIFSGSTVLSVWGLGVDHYESSQSWMLFDAGFSIFLIAEGVRFAACTAHRVSAPSCPKDPRMCCLSGVLPE